MKTIKYTVCHPVDLETEPDYCVTLKCIKCDESYTLSGQYTSFHEIDNYNFICEECRGYDPSHDLPCGHPLI